MTDESKLEHQELGAAEFVDELSDEALDRPGMAAATFSSVR